eukprot:9923144-Ditylum_brightwellii.AAC.1
MFSRTMLLQNCVSVAVGVQNNGNDLYWGHVYTALGMEISSNLSSFWKKEDNITKKKRQRQASREYKKKRAEDNHEKMAEEAKKVISNEKQKFTYMAASFITPHELEAAKKNKRRKMKLVVCYQT